MNTVTQSEVDVLALAHDLKALLAKRERAVQKVASLTTDIENCRAKMHAATAQGKTTGA